MSSSQLPLIEFDPLPDSGEIFVLTPRESLELATVLLDPPGPNEALVAASRVAVTVASAFCSMKHREHDDADWIVYKPYPKDRPVDMYWIVSAWLHAYLGGG